MEIEMRVGDSHPIQLKDGRVVMMKFVAAQPFKAAVLFGFDGPRDIRIDREEVHKMRMEKK